MSNDKLEGVPFFRPEIGDDEIRVVTECLRSGWLTTGPKVARFESDFSTFIAPSGEVHAISVNSATAGLHLALEALGIGVGDEVIVPTLTFTATAEVIRYLGATPVLVDVDDQTLCIDLDAIQAAITPATKVIMPVHFGGRPCDMTRIRKIADQHNLKVVDDAAHCLPGFHKGKMIGDAFADITVFSFYANKTITTGEGGMVTTRDAELASRIKVMRLHGIDRDVFDRFSSQNANWFYDVVAPGFKYNLTDIAAAMGVEQLKRAEDFREKREACAIRYRKLLQVLPIALPPEADGADMHSWHLFPIVLTSKAKASRDEVIRHLQSRHIGVSVHYRPLHHMTVWREFRTGNGYPNADKYYENCISIPLFPSMTDAEQDKVVAALSEVL